MILDKNNKPIKKFEPEPEEEKPVIKKPSLKRRLLKALIVVIAIIALALYALYEVDKFFDRNTFIWVVPVELHLPIKIEPRQASAKQVEVIPTVQAAETTAAVVPVEQPKPVVVTNPKLTDLVNDIYMLESSGGKNDSCKAKGLFNGYGYRQNKNEWKCFTTHDEVKGYVAELFAKRLKTMSLPVALCYYNLGIKTDNCTYYQNYLKLQ